MIQLNKFTLDEVAIFVKFSAEYYLTPETNSAEFINWKFLGNSCSSSWHLKCFEGGELTGRAVLSEKNLNIYGKKYVITQVTDLLASPKNKSVLTFFQLIKNYKLLNSNGVFHTSNEKSDAVYSDLFKFKKILSMTAFGFPLNFSKLSQKKCLIFPLQLISLVFKPSIKLIIATLDFFSKITVCDGELDEEVGGLLKCFESSNVNFSRSIDFMKWRFWNTNCDYRIKLVKKKYKLCGIYIYRVTDFDGAKFLILMDVIFPEELKFSSIFFIKLNIIKNAISENCDAVFGMLNKKNKKDKPFLMFPFIRISDKMLPHATPIYVSSLNQCLVKQDLSNTYFSLADLDYF